MSHTEFIIGIDVGTTAVKAALINLSGQAVASFKRPFETSRPQPGHVEQDPQDWMEAIDAALDEFAGLTDAVLGIGLTSQVNTHTFVADDGLALRPAIVWQDVRCGTDAASLDRQVSEDQKTTWFGGPMPIDASHALSRIAHIARVEPALFSKTRHVLLPKDYCAFRLTGQLATDPISSVGLVDQNHDYIEELIGLVAGARPLLADLHGLRDRVGFVREGRPFAGAPVYAGTMDAWAGMFGVGVVRDGEAMYLSGTSEVAGIISDQVQPTPGIIVFPSYEQIRLHAAPTQSGGASLDWVAKLVGQSQQAALQLAAESGPSARSTPIFLPHLQGERAPFWDSKSRGVFARLDSATEPGDIVRSVLDGVAYSVRLAFDALEQSADTAPGCINLGGGGSRSDLWCQIRADVLGKQVRRTAIADAGVLGAAILAGVGCGAFSDMGTAADQLVRFDQTFSPNPDLADYHGDRLDHFRQLYADLKPFNDRF